jgi:hypothetical protein
MPRMIMISVKMGTCITLCQVANIRTWGLTGRSKLLVHPGLTLLFGDKM